MDLPWRVKQLRADQHIRQLADSCSQYLDSANVGLRYDHDPVAGTIRVRFEADTEPPMALGAIIGDILHNLRLALDAVAWETCQRAGVPTEREKDVYFPIGTNPAGWTSLARRQLPAVSDTHLEVFRRLQPWFWDEEARAHGASVTSSAHSHPLNRLHELARVDRHRVPHPVLARAGETWLGGPESATVRLARPPVRHSKPGETVLEWLVDPPHAVSEFEAEGEAIVVLSDDAAARNSPAVRELEAMQQAVIQATRTVEVDVLEVVSSADMEVLTQLSDVSRSADQALRDLRDSPHVIDAEYVDRYSTAAAQDDAARTAYLTRWRELFD